jgi:hypothetical protein
LAASVIAALAPRKVLHDNLSAAFGKTFQVSERFSDLLRDTA